MIKLKTWAIALATFISALILAFFKGKNQAQISHEKEQANDYKATRKRVDNVRSTRGPNVAREELLARIRQRGL